MLRARGALWAVFTAIVCLTPGARAEASAHRAPREPEDRRARAHAPLSRITVKPARPDSPFAGKDASDHEGALPSPRHGSDDERHTAEPKGEPDRRGKGSGKRHVGEVRKAKLRPIRPVPPNATWLRYRRAPRRRGYVTLFGHGQKWSGILVGQDGAVPPAARRAFSHVLASWRTGKEMPIDERLIQLVADVSDEFGGRPIRIVSGYREHSYAPDSKHKVGQAFDFSIPGVPNEMVRDFLRSLPDTGVGYYPNSTHVHLDVRDKPTYWVDYSAPGQKPQYSYAKHVVARWTARERAIAAALEALPQKLFAPEPARAPADGSRAVTSAAPSRAPSPQVPGKDAGLDASSDRPTSTHAVHAPEPGGLLKHLRGDGEEPEDEMEPDADERERAGIVPRGSAAEDAPRSAPGDGPAPLR
jgi:hypothetical protein